jgi:hypothetical protein
MLLAKIRAFLAPRSTQSRTFDPGLFDGVWIGEATLDEFNSDGNTTKVLKQKRCSAKFSARDVS